MYKRLLLLIPVILLTIWLASTLERSYTEPEIVNGAISRAPIVHTDLPADPQASEGAEITTIPEPAIRTEPVQALPETEPSVSDVPHEPVDPPNTASVPESTTVPEIPVIPEPTPIPETSAIAETSSTPETTAPPETTAEPPSQTDTQTVTVYWVPNGEVWHTKINCSTLSRSKNILSGTLEAAMQAGKERVCKRCG